MDEWGWEQLGPWLYARLELPVGPLFCIIDGPTRGRSWSAENSFEPDVRPLRRAIAFAGQIRDSKRVEELSSRSPITTSRRPSRRVRWALASPWLVAEQLVDDVLTALLGPRVEREALSQTALDPRLC
jgi:hypothetical protein